jgi:hypothetical protein
VSEQHTHEEQGRHSKTADGSAARWGERNPDDDIDHPPPPHVPEPDDEVPNRHSASAEAASLRWRERHEDDDEGS